MLELSCTQERHIRHQERLMNKNTIAIAIAALLVGGVSVAAFQQARGPDTADAARSEEHTSELQSLMRISYAVFCFKKKNKAHVAITAQYQCQAGQAYYSH